MRASVERLGESHRPQAVEQASSANREFYSPRKAEYDFARDSSPHKLAKNPAPLGRKKNNGRGRKCLSGSFSSKQLRSFVAALDSGRLKLPSIRPALLKIPLGGEGLNLTAFR